MDVTSYPHLYNVHKHLTVTLVLSRGHQTKHAAVRTLSLPNINDAYTSRPFLKWDKVYMEYAWASNVCQLSKVKYDKRCVLT